MQKSDRISPHTTQTCLFPLDLFFFLCVPRIDFLTFRHAGCRGIIGKQNSQLCWQTHMNILLQKVILPSGNTLQSHRASPLGKQFQQAVAPCGSKGTVEVNARSTFSQCAAMFLRVAHQLFVSLKCAEASNTINGIKCVRENSRICYFQVTPEIMRFLYRRP